MTKARSVFILILFIGFGPKALAVNAVPWTDSSAFKPEQFELPLVTSTSLFSWPKPSPRFVVLDFWASWCGPCAKSFPFYEQEFEKWKKHGVLFLGINMDSDKALGQTWLKEKASDFPQIFDSKGELKRMFQIQSLPRLVILDHDLKVVKAYRGFYAQSPETLKFVFKELFSETKMKAQPNTK